MNNELKELSKQIKRLNQRLRQLEKSGLAKSSNWYAYVEKDSIGGKGYLTTTKSGEIKFRTDVTKMKEQTLRALQKRVKYGLEAHTGTVSGIKKVWQQSYNSFINNPENESMKNISFSDYVNIAKDEREKKIIKNYGYSQMMELISEAHANGITTDAILTEMEKTISVGIVKKWIEEHSHINEESPDIEDEDEYIESDEDFF